VRTQPEQGIDERARDLLARRTGTEGTVTLSLTDVVFLSLSRNLTLKSAREERAKAQADAFAALSGMLPQVSVSGSYVRIDKGATADFGGVKIKLSPEDRYKTELSIQQPIFQGGMAYHGYQAARIVARIADLGVTSAEEQVSFAATVRYYDTLLAKASLGVAEENVDLSREHLTNVQKRLKQGMASRFEELRAKTQVAGMETLVIQAENALKVKRLEVLRVAALPLDMPMNLSGAIISRPLKVEFNDAYRAAWKNRPDLAAAALGIRAQDRQISALRAGLMPKLYGFFNWGWEKPSGKSFIAGAGAGYWNGGLTLSVPVFDGGATHARLMKAHATRRQAQFRLEDLREEIALEIRKALLNLDDAAKAVESATKNLRLAQEGQRLARVGYENGVNTQLDVLEADNAYVRAMFGRLQALFGHIMAREALRRAMGIARWLAVRRPQAPPKKKAPPEKKTDSKEKFSSEGEAPPDKDSPPEKKTDGSK
jgi:outer membrane protein TolC